MIASRRVGVALVLLMALTAGLLLYRHGAGTTHSSATTHQGRTAPPLGDAAFATLFDATQPLPGQRTNLNQGTCGIALTIQRVYADQERILIGYVLTFPAGNGVVTSDVSPPTLADAHGHSFQLGVESAPMMCGNAEGGVIEFDSNSGVPLPRTARLRLTVPAVRLTEYGARPARKSVPNPALRFLTGLYDRLFNVSGCVSYKQLSVNMWTATIRGHWTYDLSVRTERY